MRKNKNLLFGGMGFLGGVAGGLVGEAVRPGGLHSYIESSVGSVAKWSACIGVGILLGLTWALAIYSGRRFPSGKKIAGAVFSGFLAGAFAGGIAQGVFMIHRFIGTGQFFFQSGCWGLAGAILGLWISRAIPNLGAARGAFAGLMGGWIGGMGFLALAIHLDEGSGRVMGVGIIGAALGLAIVIVETIFREASLEVIWAPKESTILSLGPRPIWIGGGDDHIHITGMRQHTASLQLM